MQANNGFMAWMAWVVWLVGWLAVCAIKCRIGWIQTCDGSVCSADLAACDVGIEREERELGTRCVSAKTQLETSSRWSWITSELEAPVLCIPGLLLPARSTYLYTDRAAKL